MKKVESVKDTDFGFGFIMTRHVCNSATNELWQESYRCIRKYYPDSIKILIIDDNSKQEFVKHPNLELINTEIVQSQFPKRGELLSYYYFLKLRPFEKAVVIHDSIFIKRFINFSLLDDFCPLFSFKRNWDNPDIEIPLVKQLENSKLNRVYQSKEWLGCFGVMGIISYKTIQFLQEEYNFPNKLIANVDSREKRMGLERILGLLYFEYCQKNSIKMRTLFGDIHNFIQKNYSIFGFQGWSCYFMTDYNAHKYLDTAPIIKVWASR